MRLIYIRFFSSSATALCILFFFVAENSKEPTHLLSQWLESETHNLPLNLSSTSSTTFLRQNFASMGRFVVILAELNDKQQCFVDSHPSIQ